MLSLRRNIQVTRTKKPNKNSRLIKSCQDKLTSGESTIDEFLAILLHVTDGIVPPVYAVGPIGSDVSNNSIAGDNRINHSSDGDEEGEGSSNESASNAPLTPPMSGTSPRTPNRSLSRRSPATSSPRDAVMSPTRSPVTSTPRVAGMSTTVIRSPLHQRRRVARPNATTTRATGENFK